MSQLPEWCTKKQTAKMISRTERTVSRVVRDAVDKRTDDILANLKLVYANGDEVPGSDVTVELLAKNEEEGSRTRWFFRRTWWRDDFAQRINEASYADVAASATDDEARAESPAGGGVGQELLGEPPPLPVDPAVRAVVLEHLPPQQPPPRRPLASLPHSAGPPPERRGALQRRCGRYAPERQTVSAGSRGP